MKRLLPLLPLSSLCLPVSLFVCVSLALSLSLSLSFPVSLSFFLFLSLCSSLSSLLPWEEHMRMPHQVHQSARGQTVARVLGMQVQELLVLKNRTS
jgi:hypothetical protein